MKVAVIAAAFAVSSVSLASRIVGTKITGQVTSVAGVDAVTINGQQYPIKVGSPAAEQIGSVTSGETVDAVLDGPPDSSSTHVVAIHAHNGQ